MSTLMKRGSLRITPDKKPYFAASYQDHHGRRALSDGDTATYASPCDSPRDTAHVFSGEGGIRTISKTPANSALLDERAAKSDALAVTDPELLQVVRAWPDLPEPVRLAVLALVRSHLA